MKYLTEDEVIQIHAVLASIKDWQRTKVLGTPLTMDVVFSDSNGEHVGNVGITDEGKYGFIFPVNDADV